jgi:uncharacterized Zn finger protein (UPF0148 family)
MKKKCPRCGIKQDGLVECEICGLFFESSGKSRDEAGRAL